MQEVTPFISLNTTVEVTDLLNAVLVALSAQIQPKQILLKLLHLNQSWVHPTFLVFYQICLFLFVIFCL